jgi:paraquat-inducible protein B
MSKPANKTLIGGFVVGALALVVIAIVVLGSGKLFSDRQKGVLYFDGSVKGLNVGSPVMFRGVKIGSVTGISFRFDPATLRTQIPVFIEFEKERIDRTSPMVDPVKTMKALISKGFRAQLETQSFVTGQLMISTDFYPDKPAKFAGDGSLPEIPTIPSSLEQLTKSIEKLPLEELANKLTSAVGGMDRLVNAPEIKQSLTTLAEGLKDVQKLIRNADAQVGPIGSAVQETVRDAQKMVRRVDGQVEPISSSLQKTLEDTRNLVGNVNNRVDPLYVEVLAVIKQAGSALKTAEASIAELGKGTERDSELMVGLADSLGEFEKAARSIRALADYLEKNPEALLRGKGQVGGK